MLSLTQFRQQCLPLFRVMRDTHMEMEIVYKGKVYDMSITETDKEPRLVRPKRKAPEQIRVIDVQPCPECASLMFNNICMNSNCIHATGTILETASTLPNSSL